MYDNRGKQFQVRPSSLISLAMVRDVLRTKREVGNEFKWNFLILLYNFFIESSQNAWLMRDVMRFSRDIDKCGDYN